MRRVGLVGLRAIVYFEVVSTIALIIGLIVGNLFPAGAGLHIDPVSLDPKPVAGFVSSAQSITIVDFLTKMIPTNMIGALAKGEITPVLIMAVLVGFALIHMGERGQRIVVLIDDFTHAVFGVVRMIMYLAPLAAFAAMAFTVGKFGFGTLASWASSSRASTSRRSFRAARLRVDRPSSNCAFGRLPAISRTSC